MKRVLVIDDDSAVRDILQDFLTLEGYMVNLASDGAMGIDALNSDNYDVILLDLVMPNMGGIDVLKGIKETRNADTPCVILTAHGTVQNAVEAMKLGAFDYVTKPFRLDEVKLIVDRAIEVSKIKKENVRLKRELKKRYEFHGLIGSSPEMQDVYSLIEKIADTDSTILITGDSGTGKELAAKITHYNSSRSERNFVPLNCAAIPKDLLESELFGHERGAFTGAVTTRIGRFELANNGTLFLDEIGELDPSLQVKLLRVLQEREFERIGSTKTIKVDVRIIAATNKDLERHTKEGRFRADLFYRLNVIPIHLPPLKGRQEDIPLLVEHFLKKHSKSKKRPQPKITDRIMDVFMNYQWPGNVRELENLIERLTILNPGETVDITDLPKRFHGIVPAKKVSASKANPSEELSVSPEGVDLNGVIDDIERKLIVQALQLSKGVKSKAASLLGLNRTTLVEKMKKKGIEVASKN
ncbi:transcriptional regulatory protein ZraR [bacterium BMS3Bbin06]|nr:transcriptional regulatory protein ZraR [bacterium BMS3Abin08]GBE33831.1 transcriptional regulatory protein ZraR [bacterium BMS3Bbin06]HDO36261.1 sigma-54-dependent Fis family transcriptional regulator [Nitrospirota bacterium]HDY71687.1 sigma-54-dependent Fis family transcriptional regulator [Nitrospirota bacterium]